MSHPYIPAAKNSAATGARLMPVSANPAYNNPAANAYPYPSRSTAEAAVPMAAVIYIAPIVFLIIQSFSLCLANISESIIKLHYSVNKNY